MFKSALKRLDLALGEMVDHLLGRGPDYYRQRELAHLRILGGNYPQAMFVNEPARDSDRTEAEGVLEAYLLHEDGSLEPVRSFASLLEVRYGHDVESLLPGGVIVLSTDITPTGSPQSWRQKLKVFATTWIQRFVKERKSTVAIERVRKDTGFSIGNLFLGRYVASTGEVFDEKSFAVEIVGITSQELEDIGSELLEEFGQQSVLVKDHATGKVYFVKKSKSRA